jgi:transcription elongation factor SPT6
MVIPVSIKRCFQEKVEVKLDCGIEGVIAMDEFPEDFPRGGDPRQIWAPHQVVRAKVKRLERKYLTAELSLRDEELRNAVRRNEIQHAQDEWDNELEARDQKEAKKLTDGGQTRLMRQVKHPLFRQWNSRQAEEYLMGMNRGDCIIRQSSKGPDHLAVTWKIHDNLYQHIDVLELDKENEYSVGKTLKVGGKYTYSDLDELITMHVMAMSKKVDEMMGDERYQSGSRAQAGSYPYPIPTPLLIC